MGAGFTPGPWLIEPQGERARGHWLADNAGAYVALACSRDNSRDEEDANARLIAAAPELYEALALAAEWIAEDGASLSEVAEAKIYAALAKARGEQVSA